MAAPEHQPLQGMSDLSSPEICLWQDLEARARALLTNYGYSEVRTPVLERTDVFVRSIGDTTDVVQKEMYAFEDRGGRQVAMRPEGTAGVMRFLAGGGPEARQARVYYLGPMFRAERPQAGRKRQFHQLGAEALGPAVPAADAECLAMQCHLLSHWGLNGCRVHLNTRGLPEDREAVQAGLRDALRPQLENLCDDCQRRFETNVLRILDCKEAKCGEIVEALPPVTDFMCEESVGYLDDVAGFLRRLEVDFEINPRLVRGLDYYVHTVWEITHPSLGAQDAVSGGGRYRIDVGGAPMEGVGFAVGLERIIAALQAGGEEAKIMMPKPQVWVVTQGERAFEDNLVFAMMLRERGISCEIDLQGRSMKAQMRAAGRSGAEWVIIRGDGEMGKGTFMVKNMTAGEQEELALPDVLERLSRVIK